MRLDPEIVKRAIIGAMDPAVAEQDADIVDAIAAAVGGEPTLEQLALLDFLFEEGGDDAG